MMLATRSGVRTLRFCSAGKKPGHQRVDPDPVRRPFAGQVLGQVVHGGLGGRIGEDPRQGHQARHGPDVDDRTALARSRPGACRRPGSRGRPTFRLTRTIRSNSSSGDLEEGRGGIDPGAVDDDVDPAGLAGRRPREAPPAPPCSWPPPRETSPCPRRARSAPAAACAFSALRPTRTTSAPAAASPSAIAPQSSPVPPMTTATRPARPKSSPR